MLNAFTLDPSRTLDAESGGLERAMVEMLILMAAHHGASRLEYRTIEGEFRVAEIIDECPHEFAAPPNCVRQTTMDHLRKVFPFSRENRCSEGFLRVGTSLARAQCEISNDGQDATVTFLENFDAAVNLRSVMDRFWEKRAANQRATGLARY